MSIPSQSNLVLGVVVALIAANYLITRTQLGRRLPMLFWLINGLDLAAGLGVLLFGVPGFEHSTTIRFVLGLVVLMHLAQNFHAKTRWDAEERERRLEEEDIRRDSGG
jgi:hypothetical protein